MISDAELHGLCHRIVLELISRYGWHIIPEDDFVVTVVGRARAVNAQTESRVQRIAKNVYSNALYLACRAGEGPEASQALNQAYEELGRYLYDIARYRQPDHPEDAEEATQRALMDIYQAVRSDKCRTPDAFLAFCIWRLRGALTHVARSKGLGGKRALSWDRLVSGTGEDDLPAEREPSLRVKPGANSPENVARRQLQAEAVWAELRRKYKKHPRATKQLDAVILKHAFDCQNEQIADTLGVASTGAVSSLINRGKKKLEKNQQFRELFVPLSSGGLKG